MPRVPHSEPEPVPIPAKPTEPAAKPGVRPLIILGVGVVLIGIVYLATRENRTLVAAHAAADKRDFATAMKLIDEYIGDHSPDQDTLLFAARTARRGGEFRLAERYIDRFQKGGGDKQLVDMERALRSIQIGESRPTKELLNYALEHPTDYSSQFVVEAVALGGIAAATPRPTLTAVDSWLKIPTTPENQAEAQFLRGRAFQILRDDVEAASSFREALKLWPAHPNAEVYLAETFLKSDPKQALSVYEKLGGEQAGRTDVRLGVSRARRQLGDVEAANRLISQLVTEFPDSVPVLCESARLDLERKQPAAAEPKLRTALAFAPNYLIANELVLQLLQAQGKTAEAEKQRERVNELDADSKKRLEFTPGS